MDPDSIELNNLSKSFAYQKLASQIDSCEDRDELRNIAKSFIKLYKKYWLYRQLNANKQWNKKKQRY